MRSPHDVLFFALETMALMSTVGDVLTLACGFRRNPATYSDLIPATVPS